MVAVQAAYERAICESNEYHWQDSLTATVSSAWLKRSGSLKVSRMPDLLFDFAALMFEVVASEASQIIGTYCTPVGIVTVCTGTGSNQAS